MLDAGTGTLELWMPTYRSHLPTTYGYWGSYHPWILEFLLFAVLGITSESRDISIHKHFAQLQNKGLGETTKNDRVVLVLRSFESREQKRHKHK